MKLLEYRLAAALIVRMQQRSLISKEQYLGACTFLEEESAREERNGAD